MTTARSQQIDLQSTPYYHVISRCVRRAFLCGQDTFTGKNFDHRKQWIVERMQFLASGFAIDICAFAVMSNHYHIVLHVDTEQANAWTDAEVIER
jgi:REP element-mobilizing transposase RayT